MIFERVAKRFGPAAAVFLGIVLCVKWFADEATEHQIVRELFFHETTKAPYVQLFFACMIALIVFDGFLLRRYLSGDSAEVKRLRAEVERLQGQLLEAPPSTEVGQ